MSYLTKEQMAIAKPPIQKKEKGGDLKVPTKEKRPSSTGRKPSTSPQRKGKMSPKPTAKPTSKIGFKK